MPPPRRLPPQVAARRIALGDALREARLRRGLTQEQVANAIELDRPSVVRIERGQVDPYLSTLLRIESVLRVRLVIEDEPSETDPPRPE